MFSTSIANDVRQTMDQFRRSVDQMFDNFYGQNQPVVSNSAGERSWTFSPVLESAWNENFLHLRAILPGIPEKDLHVSVQNNQLVLEGERRMPEGFEKNANTQLAYGRFYAALTLPANLDVDHIRCNLNDGVLDIQVPVAAASKPRQIQIQTGEQQRAIGA